MRETPLIIRILCFVAKWKCIYLTDDEIRFKIVKAVRDLDARS